MIPHSRGTGRKSRPQRLAPRSGAKLTLLPFPTAYAVGYDLSLLRSLARIGRAVRSRAPR